jgi:hypothetical protein
LAVRGLMRTTAIGQKQPYCKAAESGRWTTLSTQRSR